MKPMRFYALPFLFLFSIQNVCAQALHYTIRQHTDSTLLVNLQFIGDLDGLSTLNLPIHPECLLRVRPLSEGSRLKFNPDANTFLLAYPLGQKVQLEYEISSRKQAFYPEITSDHFLMLSSDLLLTPLDRKSWEIDISWEGFPVNFPLFNCWGQAPLQQHLFATDQRWLESAFAGGQWTPIAHQGLQVLYRKDAWAFPIDTLLTVLNNAVEVQCKYWQDTLPAPFCIFLAPMQISVDRPDSFQYNGMGLQSGFVMYYARPGPAFEIEQVQHLFQHELGHQWIGARIRCSDGPTDARHAWFAEGFTEYLAWWQMLNCGQTSDSAFVQQINRQFELLYHNPFAQASNDSLAANFYTNPVYRSLAYQRGFEAALYLDLLLRAKSGDQIQLQNWLLTLLNYYNAPLHKNSVPRQPDFLQLSLQSICEENMDYFFVNYIEKGQLIPVEQFELPEWLGIRARADGVPMCYLLAQIPK